MIGDITAVTTGIILHQVNCQGKMGAGIAKNIADKWPIVKKSYHSFCMNKRPAEMLGRFQIVKVTDSLYVCNIFGQLNYGRTKGVCYTNYEALEYALSSLSSCLRKERQFAGLPIFYPKMGCNLGGADWSKVSIIIDDAFNNMEHYLLEPLK